ncbi:MAG: discoidin domain-containing protein [Bacteroidota bacterium]
MGQQSVHHDAMGQLLVAVEDTISPAIPIRPMSVEDAQTHFLLPPGYQIEPVLTEPVIKEPAAIAFDGDGRMFVLELRTYMQDIDATDELKPLSRISMHEDLDDDGVYETHHIFVDSLIFPRFVMPFGKNSILSMESNEDEVYLFTDVDGDGQADKKELFTTNYGKSGNVEHQQSFLYWGMDNWLYSTYNNFRIRWTPNGIQKESTGSNRAQWGVTQDNEGKMWFQGGASGLPSYFQFPIVYGNFDIDEPYADGFKVPYGIAGVGDYQPGPILSREDGTLNQVTGSAGNDIVRGHRMPADLAGHYLYGEPVGRIVRRIEPVNTEGLTQLHNYYQADSSEFIRSTDPLFRPVDIASAPDGSVYIVDMYRGIIQQGNWVQNRTFLRAKVKQYELDKAFGHGRIWRITHKGTPRDATRPQMHSETPAQWVNHLAHPNGTWRDAAQRLLVLEQDKSVVPALEAMVRNSETPYAQYHALWTLEGLSALDADLVHTLLLDASPNMQIQALRVSESLYKKGDRSFDAMYERLAADENADVAIQAMLTMKVLDPSNKTEAIEQAMAANPAAGVQFVGDKILNPPNYGRRGGPQLSAVEQQRLEDGADIFNDLCVQCHGNNGTGMDVGNGQFMAPPLANSDHVYGHEDYVIKTLLHGISGPIDGISYPGGIMLGMPEQTDEWIASVASFIRTNLSNEAEMVTPESVARVRAATADKTTPYTYETLQASVPAPLRFDRDVWKVSASHTADSRVGGSASPIGALSFEGWSTGAPQVPGMWFQVEMPAPVSLAQIEFVSPSKWRGGGSDAPPPLETYPRAYSVQTSLDGETWSQPVAEGTGEHSDITIAFAPTKARFVRITQHATEDEAPWSMQELKLFGVEVAGPLQNE